MLSKRAMHALDLVVAIASTPTQKLATTASLSREMDLSVSYLEQILKELREAGLVESHRGSHGGYQIANGVDQMSAWDVLAPFAANTTLRRYPNSNPESLVMDSLERDYLDTMAKALSGFSVGSLHKAVTTDELNLAHA